MEKSQIPIVVAHPDLKNITAAGAQVGGSRWVCMLGFTELAQEDTSVQEQIVVSISVQWPLMKALSTMINNAVAEYEANEGEISQPKTFVEQQNKKAP